MPTGRAALVIVSVSVPLAVLRPDDWLIVPIALGAVLLLMTGDFFAAPSPSGIEVVREFPASLTLGERGELRWLVQNRSGRAARVSVADALWPSLQASRQAIPLRGKQERHRPYSRPLVPTMALTDRDLCKGKAGKDSLRYFPTTSPWPLEVAKRWCDMIRSEMRSLLAATCRDKRTPHHFDP